MRKSIKLIALLISLAGCFTASAQQDPRYTGYLTNMLPINPAYAGSINGISSTLMYRNQWTRLEGAPVNLTASIHSPIENTKGAVGLLFVNDQQGLQSTNTISGVYSYKISLPSGSLSLGLQGSIINYNLGLNRLYVKDPNDPAFTANESLWLPNVGAGIYYQNDKLALGISSPRLISSNLIEDYQYVIGEPKSHYFLTAAYLFDLNADWKLKASTLGKYVPNAPFNADLNATFIFQDRIWIGAGFRTFSEWSILTQYQVNRNLWIGYAFDVAIQTYNRGLYGPSHEIALGYNFSLNKSRIISPRYF